MSDFSLFPALITLMTESAIASIVTGVVTIITVIAATWLQSRKLPSKDSVDQVHELVNNKSKVQEDAIEALKLEVARLNQNAAAFTPLLPAKDGEPGQVTMIAGVVKVVPEPLPPTSIVGGQRIDDPKTPLEEEK